MMNKLSRNVRSPFAPFVTMETGTLRVEIEPMNEKKWLECAEPKAMFKTLRCRLRHRKVRLFAVACCRCNWHYFTDERSRTAVEIAERHADGAASDEELRQAYVAASAVHAEAFRIYGKGGACVEWGAAYVADRFAYTAATNVSWMSANRRERNASKGADLHVQAALVREIFGNPFRPVLLDPRWQTSTVVDLARAIYDGRAFDRMPILGDALMDAGCDNENTIAHCRSSGPHVRGCWLVDFVLEKS
jgi:hypothetical protein